MNGLIMKYLLPAIEQLSQRSAPNGDSLDISNFAVVTES